MGVKEQGGGPRGAPLSLSDPLFKPPKSKWNLVDLTHGIHRNRGPGPFCPAHVLQRTASNSRASASRKPLTHLEAVSPRPLETPAAASRRMSCPTLRADAPTSCGFGSPSLLGASSEIHFHGAPWANGCLTLCERIYHGCFLLCWHWVTPFLPSSSETSPFCSCSMGAFCFAFLFVSCS